MISSSSDLTPNTSWKETVWAHTSEESLVDQENRPRLCVAVLLPFHNRQPDWRSFENCIHWMQASADAYAIEIIFVLNADTGYIFQLSPELYEEVIRRFRTAFPKSKAICGTTAVGMQGSDFRAEWYRHHLEIAQSFDNVEVMIMTSRLLDQLEPEKRRDAYFEILEMVHVPALVHSLEPAFTPWARPFGPWLLHELAKHEKIVGGKISTLDEPHFLYWASMSRHLRLNFVPHSGDDFGIASAIKMGLPLLIGAGASACPLICAAKAVWTEKPLDTRVYKLFEAIQSMEDLVFRLDANRSAAAYKHSTAHLLKILGLIQSAEVHPDCEDRRPDGEDSRMREALIRALHAAKQFGIRGFEIPST